MHGVRGTLHRNWASTAHGDRSDCTPAKPFVDIRTKDVEIRETPILCLLSFAFRPFPKFPLETGGEMWHTISVLPVKGQGIRISCVVGGSRPVATAGWGEASRRAARETNQLERNTEMPQKLPMPVGTARRAVRNLALLATFDGSFIARAATETVGGYTWT